MNKEEMEKLSLEDAFEKVEATMSELQSDEMPLEESFQLYQEGMMMLKYCSDKIERVEKQVLAMGEEGELHEF